MTRSPYQFVPEQHESELIAILQEVQQETNLDADGLSRILRKYPRSGNSLFSKSELICGYRYLRQRLGWEGDETQLLERLRMKPIRTLSGVAPVTVLTKPFPCPGRCIFCPSDVRMPKSYIASEPGAQRAAQHTFDPYRQTLSRLQALYHNGHSVDKVELIILGGTWSYYPEAYQVWFVKRCFDALNDFAQRAGERLECQDPEPIYQLLRERVEKVPEGSTYNEIVSDVLLRYSSAELISTNEQAGWADLARSQRANEQSDARCVGLVVETRPDHISAAEVVRIRRLGATKVQIGYQSLSDEVLAKNRRGHRVAATRRAMFLLRQAGFKIHAHWMPNLYGSSPQGDIEDFDRIFSDPDFRPDELKIYPCSLIESAELTRFHQAGAWRPYSHDEIVDVVTECLRRVPEYCRVTRVIRDIPSTDILVGNKLTNLRQVAEEELERRGGICRDIRSREIRERPVSLDRLHRRQVAYETATGRELFLQMTTSKDHLVGFLRLSLPQIPSFLGEIRHSALLREVHVYGLVAGLGERNGSRSQHLGVGKTLIGEAEQVARQAGYSSLAVISSVGTREYYRGLGFRDGELYQHRSL